MTTLTKDERQELAVTIIKQLGGQGRLVAMTGAHTFIAHESGLSFKFKGSRQVNYVKITLDPSDTYSLEFGKIWGMDYKVKAEHENVYNDQLIKLFEAETGLYLTL